MHLVDTTLFYSPTSGGVKRYLTAKHAWLAGATLPGSTRSWCPGEENHFEPGEVCTLSGFPVPGTFNYRLPLNPRRWTRMLSALSRVSSRPATRFIRPGPPGTSRERRGIPDRGVLSLQSAADSRPPLRRRPYGAHPLPLPALAVRALRRCIRAEPADVRVSQQHGSAPTRCTSRWAWMRRSFIRSDALTSCASDSGCRPTRACWCMRAASPAKRICRCCCRRSRGSGSPYHLLMIGGDREARPTPQRHDAALPTR